MCLQFSWDSCCVWSRHSPPPFTTSHQLSIALSISSHLLKCKAAACLPFGRKCEQAVSQSGPTMASCDSITCPGSRTAADRSPAAGGYSIEVVVVVMVDRDEVFLFSFSSRNIHHARLHDSHQCAISTIPKKMQN